MTGRDNRIEVVSVVQRHQQRSWAEKARIVAEADAPSGARRDIDGMIEVSVGGTITVRISGSVATETLAAVFSALKALPAKAHKC